MVKKTMETNKLFSDIQDETSRREAIENDLNLRLRQQEAIAWIGEFAIRVKDLNELYAEAAKTVSLILDMEFVKILELLPGGEDLLLRAGVGWKEDAVGRQVVSAGTGSQSGYTLLTQEPVIVMDYRRERRFSESELLRDYRVLSGMSVVIPGKEKPFGVLGTHSGKSRIFLPHDTRFIKAIANILGSAVERLRVEEELRRSRDELSIILDGVSEGITVQDQTGNLAFANQAAAKLMGFDSAQELLQTPLNQIMQRFAIWDTEGKPMPVDALPGRMVLKGAPKASARIRFRKTTTGEERWSITDATPVHDNEGRIVQTVNIFRDITDIVHSEQRQKLIAEAGEVLSSSLDYETTLENFTDLMVNNLADWCSVHLINGDQQVNRISVAHRDPEKIALVQELERRYPPDPESERESAIFRVIQTGKAEFIPEVPDSLLEASARDAEHLAMMRALQIHSAVVIPMAARGKTLGALTLVWAEAGRTYTEAEVALAEELTNRAALAIDNSRLFQEAQALNTELEERVERRTRQLEISNHQLSKEVEERKKAESELQKNQALLHSLFESAPDAVILVDRDGQIVRVNRQTEVIFGYQRKELVGTSVDKLLPKRLRANHGKDRALFMSDMGTRMMGAGMQLVALRKDQTEFPVDIMLSPVKTDEGDLVISAIRDMTEQRRLQTELEETHRRLFESVEAERLLLSQELHDGPIQDLYGIALQLEAVKSGLSSPEDLEDLTATAESVQAIIQTLRAICGELRPPVLTQFGLEKAIRSHLTRVQEAHPEIHIEAKLVNDGQKLSERVRLVLYRVYQNAISNTLRHAQAKNVQLQFFLDTDHVSLTVSDDGRGFVMPKRRVELVRSGHFGLAGVAERVEALGGRLDVKSAPGKGTTIQVDLPSGNL